MLTNTKCVNIEEFSYSIVQGTIKKTINHNGDSYNHNYDEAEYYEVEDEEDDEYY
jgi:hypothetical protein